MFMYINGLSWPDSDSQNSKSDLWGMKQQEMRFHWSRTGGCRDPARGHSRERSTTSIKAFMTDTNPSISDVHVGTPHHGVTQTDTVTTCWVSDFHKVTVHTVTPEEIKEVCVTMTNILIFKKFILQCVTRMWNMWCCSSHVLQLTSLCTMTRRNDLRYLCFHAATLIISDFTSCCH